MVSQKVYKEIWKKLLSFEIVLFGIKENKQSKVVFWVIPLIPYHCDNFDFNYFYPDIPIAFQLIQAGNTNLLRLNESNIVLFKI